MPLSPPPPTNKSMNKKNSPERKKGVNTDTDNKTPSPLKSKSSRRRQSGLDSIKEQEEEKNCKLEALEFYDCLINIPKTIKICIRNTSGVNTTFEIFSENYRPFKEEADV